MSDLPDTYDVTFPGASVLAPGIVWYKNQRTLAVYPSIMCLVDKMFWAVLATFSEKQLLASCYRACLKRHPRIKGGVDAIVLMKKTSEKGKDPNGCRFRMGTSEDA